MSCQHNPGLPHGHQNHPALGSAPWLSSSPHPNPTVLLSVPQFAKSFRASQPLHLSPPPECWLTNPRAGSCSPYKPHPKEALSDHPAILSHNPCIFPPQSLPLSTIIYLTYIVSVYLLINLPSLSHYHVVPWGLGLTCHVWPSTQFSTEHTGVRNTWTN